ncbi:uncharacterized protein LOC122375062 [Amphibalanus amphitrite]|uniref:uncharacterized protein LOC122375062 n=1 Tax=Amphibalanus amphitrite TaxID=1232801 RepID=UPI001C8FE8B5|nr:uncharacterized protein LOC122375062 [Amphibalanus amphitrite]
MTRRHASIAIGGGRGTPSVMDEGRHRRWTRDAIGGGRGTPSVMDEGRHRWWTRDAIGGGRGTPSVVDRHRHRRPNCTRTTAADRDSRAAPGGHFGTGRYERRRWRALWSSPERGATHRTRRSARRYRWRHRGWRATSSSWRRPRWSSPRAQMAAPSTYVRVQCISPLSRRLFHPINIVRTSQCPLCISPLV